VNTHATFRWRHGLFPAVDFDQMRQINADMYVCLIDGVVALHKRLVEDHAVEHSLKDLIVWREEEILGTEMLCKGIDETTALYCLARFPMTAVSNMEDVQKEINDFRRLMKQSFICFDPGDLEECYLPDKARRASEEGLDYVEATALGGQVRLDLNEVRQIQRDINSQTYARDFMLIDQSEMIISLVPSLEDGRAAISSGVERELQHAHEAAKEVYVIWTARQNPSVFVTQTATKVFGSIDVAVDFFKKKKYIETNR